MTKNVGINDSQEINENKLKIKAAYALFSKEASEINKKITDIQRNIKIRKLRDDLIDKQSTN